MRITHPDVGSTPGRGIGNDQNWKKLMEQNRYFSTVWLSPNFHMVFGNFREVPLFFN